MNHLRDTVFKIFNNDDGQFFFLILSSLLFVFQNLVIGRVKNKANLHNGGTVPKDCPDIGHQLKFRTPEGYKFVQGSHSHSQVQ